MARTQVQSELIATNAISGTIIADNAITATHIAQNSISGILIPDSGITTTMIASNNVTAAKIVTGAVANRHLASTVISSQSAVTAADGDYVLIGDTSDSNNLKKSLVSDLIQTDEEIQDIAGAMFTSNTETGITATYQDGDGTVDLVVGTLNQDTTGTAATVTGAAQTAITSVGTLTTLGVDGAVTINDSGNDVDFRVESDGNANMLFVDGGSNQVSIGNAGAVTGNNARLVVGDGSGSNTLSVYSGASSYSSIYFTDNTVNDYMGVVQYNHNGNYLEFYSNAAERLRFASNGAWGIAGANYGTDGQLLTSTGASTAPAWEDAPSSGISTGKAIAMSIVFG